MEISQVRTTMQSKSALLSWANLNVWSESKPGQIRPILQNVNGYMTPKRLLAVMGASGSGKSTLLQALIGRLSSDLKMSGTVSSECFLPEKSTKKFIIKNLLKQN